MINFKFFETKNGYKIAEYIVYTCITPRLNGFSIGA